jgi:hypothetical protein
VPMRVLRLFAQAGIDRFGVRINHAGDYPAKLRQARHPVEFLYYRGVWELTERRSVAVVGARKASAEGMARAKKLARAFADRGFVVVSGLAAGIDRAVHEAALEAGASTVAPRFRRIDQTNVGDHHHLTPADECYFLFEYTAHKRCDYSATNNLISNLKKKPGSSSIAELRYKAGAISPSTCPIRATAIIRSCCACGARRSAAGTGRRLVGPSGCDAASRYIGCVRISRSLSRRSRVVIEPAAGLSPFAPSAASRCTATENVVSPPPCLVGLGAFPAA